jgi:hypothetical protein
VAQRTAVRTLSFFLFGLMSLDIHVPGGQAACEASVFRGRERRGGGAQGWRVHNEIAFWRGFRDHRGRPSLAAIS